MRTLDVATLEQTVKRLFLEANYVIGQDILDTVTARAADEPSENGRWALEQIAKSYRIAKEERIAICQDTGMAIVFLDVGQEVLLTGGDLTQAINRGVRAAYGEGFLRKSVVSDPLFDRVNTRDNTPAIVHTRMVEG